MFHDNPHPPPKQAKQGRQGKYRQNHYKIYSRIFRFVIDFWERCATISSDLRVNLHTEVTSWLLLSLTSACPAVPAQHSVLPKQSIWAIFTTRSMPASAWSAAHALPSAPPRRSFRSDPETGKGTSDRPFFILNESVVFIQNTRAYRTRRSVLRRVWSTRGLAKLGSGCF